MRRPDVIAVVWATHEGRAAAYAECLNAPLYNIHYLQRRVWLAPIKYVLQTLKTWQVLNKDRPRFVYVTNSPPFATLAVMLFCMVTDTKYIMDIHPPSLFGKKWRWSQPLTRFMSRRAEMTVIDQERFAEILRAWGARVMILSNPPVAIDMGKLQDLSAQDEPEFVYVGTFAADEPVEIVLEAAQRLPDAMFYILGDTFLARREWLENAPSNVKFTGYLLRDDYWDRLYSARALIVLTTHAHSLLGGAMDGLYIDKPLILSDQPTLREYFTKGTIFVPNTGEGLYAGIQELLGNQACYQREIRALRLDAAAQWQRNFEDLKAAIWSEAAQ